MPFLIRPNQRFPVYCSVTYNAGLFHFHRMKPIYRADHRFQSH